MQLSCQTGGYEFFLAELFKEFPFGDDIITRFVSLVQRIFLVAENHGVAVIKAKGFSGRTLNNRIVVVNVVKVLVNGLIKEFSTNDKVGLVQFHMLWFSG